MKMENKAKFRPNPQLKLIDQVKEILRYHHYAYKTEPTYCQWIRRYIYFYDKKVHPRDLGAKDIERFLSDLAVKNRSLVGEKQFSREGRLLKG